LTEQIGNERLTERNEAVAAFAALPLAAKHQCNRPADPSLVGGGGGWGIKGNTLPRSARRTRRFGRPRGRV
jgi:hypothetical protein